MFESVEDVVQECIGSLWDIMQKKDNDGQQTMLKTRLVAQGFQEKDKLQSDSPTMAKESLKLSIVLPANKGFEMA